LPAREFATDKNNLDDFLICSFYNKKSISW
jgi:hypothetical protein